MEATHTQQRVILERAGVIDPENIQDYIARDGYAALRQVLKHMQPADVIQQVISAGLRGRGGAGFPTGSRHFSDAGLGAAQRALPVA